MTSRSRLGVSVITAALALGGLATCKRGQGRGAREVECCVAGCPVDRSVPQKGSVLKVHVEAEPQTLCQLVEHDSWSRWIVENQINETLVVQDPYTGAFTGRLAERWDTTNPLVARFTLRTGVMWHDGTPFTPADVTFTLATVQDRVLSADQRTEFEVVERSEVAGNTVTFFLKYPSPFFLQSIAHLPILPAHLLADKNLRKAGYCRAPVGTGPLAFDRWDKGQQIRLKRADHYWGAPALLDAIEFRVVRDRQVAFELARRHELDVLWRLPGPETAQTVRTDSAFDQAQLMGWPHRAFSAVVWNTQKAPFQDARVRRALGFLIDRAAFKKIAFDGKAMPVTGPYDPGSPSYDTTVPANRYDPAEARRLLKEAGQEHLTFTILVTAGSKTTEQLATLLQQEIKKLGGEMTIESLDFAALLDRLRHHRFDAAPLQWTLSRIQDNFPLFHSSQAEQGENYGGWKNSQADQLLENIRRTPGEKERVALEHQFHQLLAAEAPYAFLLRPEIQSFISARTHGLVPSTDGFGFASAWITQP